MVARAVGRRFEGYPVLARLPEFVTHVRDRVMDQGRRLGFVPEHRPGIAGRTWAMAMGLLLYVRSQFSRSDSRLDKVYLEELGFSR